MREQEYRDSWMELKGIPPKKLSVMIIHKNGEYWQFWQLISFLNTNCGGSWERGAEARRSVEFLAAVDWWHLSSLYSGALAWSAEVGRLARAGLGSQEEERWPRVDILSNATYRLLKRYNFTSSFGTRGLSEEENQELSSKMKLDDCL